MPRPITAIIITLNEERNIEGVIRSAGRVCDEVIVVDSGSADGTAKLARQLGAKVFDQPFLGDGQQKDFGVKFAKNDWILSIDADERLDEDAVKAISDLDLEGSPHDGFALRRRNFIGDRWIRIWYPDYIVRLYDRRRCRYRHDSIHAAVDAKNPARLPVHIIHYSYRDYRDYISRIEKYANWGAEVLYAKGKTSSAPMAVVHGLGAFFRHFIARGGILHGADGLVVAVTGAYVTFMKYILLREKHRKVRQGSPEKIS